MLHNIPAELRQLKQWVLADMSINPDTSQPKKTPLNPRTGQAARVDDPSTWGTFEEALATGSQTIGFVLSKSDPYCIIDLDNKPSNPATPEQLERHSKIIEAFKSYSEISISGNGCHVIVKGQIPQGRRRDHVEVYSDLRYMICTGNILNPFPIEERQDLLDLLYNEMGSASVVSDLEQIDGDLTDSEIFERASQASNADKFLSLCDGDFKEYPSQSEADFALMSIIAFYTKDNEQVRRIFRCTKLGKRDKAKRDAYLNYALSKIRANESPPVNLEAITKAAQALVKKAEEKEVELETNKTKDKEFSFPIGLLGQIAEHIFKTSIRPVREIALTAAIALVAGISGRSYNISGTGLNQYLILLAKTGSGKEGAATGVNSLLHAVRSSIPVVDQFMGPGAFSSGQALVKVLNEKPCFVSILGEFGITLQQISSVRANNAEKMLKKVLLDLYSKSGPNQTLYSSVYSDIEKNTKIVHSPNVTILGESVPESFYDGMTLEMIGEGLVPRFTIVEYKGPRPPRNSNPHQPPSAQLLENLKVLISSAITASNNNNSIPIQIEPSASKLFENFDKYADSEMDKGTDIQVQLWNRAHLKALKFAGLIAVGVNPHQPTVTDEIAQWAINFTYSELENIIERFKEGDVGTGESKQLSDLKYAIESYFKLGKTASKSYDVPEVLIKNSVVPYRYLSKRLISVASYRQDKLGSTNAIKRNIQTLIDSGMIQIVKNEEFIKKLNYSGILYIISQNWA